MDFGLSSSIPSVLNQSHNQHCLVTVRCFLATLLRWKIRSDIERHYISVETNAGLLLHSWISSHSKDNFLRAPVWQDLETFPGVWTDLFQVVCVAHFKMKMTVSCYQWCTGGRRGTSIWWTQLLLAATTFVLLNTGRHLHLRCFWTCWRSYVRLYLHKIWPTSWCM